MAVDYELCQQLQGHESQVRCVAILPDGTLVSGGLDSCVIMWRRPSTTESFALHKKLGHHSDFVYALAPSHEADGAFYSASKDRTAVRVDADGNPVVQFVGHEGAVCSVVERGSQLITGAWDGTAKVWDCKSGELRQTLDAGAHAVTVAVLPTGEIVTGSQDRSLRVFQGAECRHKVQEAHSDIIRGISVSSDHLFTASNDQLLKMWSLDGCEMRQLSGHQSFVYGVAHTNDRRTLLSASDDCTLKLWDLDGDFGCRQSVVHAGTVWQAIPLPNDDIVTSCADMLVRVWTREPSRMAPVAERETQKELAEQAAIQAASKGSSSVPDNTADISTMPTTVGKKNGEIKCFREGAVVNAYSWNEGARTWDKIGEVVGSQQEKKFYEGDACFPRGEYDFVFDVDMGPAYGMRKLPYNRGGNPMVAAEAFCSREQINKDNIGQIREFIMANAGEGGDGGGDSSGAAAPLPKPAPSPEPAASMFPVLTPLQFKDGKYDPLQSKILEFNGQVAEGLRMDAQEVQYLADAIGKLKSGSLKAEFRACEKEVIHVKLAAWPNDRLFPVIDLWRLFLLNPTSCDYFKGSDRGAPFIKQVTGLLASDAGGPLGLCSARYIANLSAFQTNRHAAFDQRALILRAVEPGLASANKHVKVACATVLLNFAIVSHESSVPPKPWDAEGAATIARLALDFLGRASPDDGDAQQRAALALGTLLPRDKANGGAIALRCREAGLAARLRAVEDKVGAKAVGELLGLLG